MSTVTRFPEPAPPPSATDAPHPRRTLLAAGTDADRAWLERTSAAMGVELLDVVAPAALPGRLARQVRCDWLWLCDVDAFADAALADVLAEGQRIAARTVLSGGVGVIDRLSGALFDDRTRIVIGDDPVERLLALGAAPRPAPTLHDRDDAQALDRIDRLQEEVARIATMLARLTTAEASALTGQGLIGQASAPAPGAAPSPFIDDYPGWSGAPVATMRSVGRDYAGAGMPTAASSRTEARVREVRRMIRGRRMRDEYFEPELFADPAWDMLLDLYVARLERKTVAVSSLCIAASVPATTALRWIRSMTDAGLFVRESDPHDGRRVFIALADPAREAMDRYFDALETV